MAVLLALTVGLAPTAQAATRFVATTGNDSSNTCLASGSPCKTITFALARALAGDTISVAAGTYNTALGESFPLVINQDLTLTGAGAGSTILDATGANTTVIVVGGQTAMISGVTITGGNVSNSMCPSCEVFGGGLFNFGTTLTLTNSTVSGNTASCTATIPSGGCFASGGGLVNLGGSLTVTNSTVSGNAASCITSGGDLCRAQGGGLANFLGPLTVTNSTVSGNTASCTAGGSGVCSASGGGISFGGGTLTLTNATVTANTVACSGAAPCPAFGGGLIGDGTTTLQNTIIAKQLAGHDCSLETVTSTGFNLDSDNTCQLTQPSDKPGASNPLLGPLQNNGGPTQTHALLPGSPAIDAVTGGCPPPVTDQRGVARPQGAACDIGAYELASSFDADAASAFVTRLYEQVLSREPDAAGLQAFVDQIAQFGSVVPTVLAFFHSQEFLDRHTSDGDFLTICYRTFLNRDPDPAGFNAFLNDLQSGLRTRDNLLDIFIDSQEFAALASLLPPQDPVTAFVTNLYVRILGRGPDLPGLQGFVVQLHQTRTVLPTVLDFLHSPEFLSRNTNNTEYVTVLYRVFLDRVPDAVGLAFWVAQLTQGNATRDQLAAQFAASAEFQAIQQRLFP